MLQHPPEMGTQTSASQADHEMIPTYWKMLLQVLVPHRLLL
jgi:hypothetical protein